MAEILIIFLIVIILTALSGFWLGFFLGRVTAYRHMQTKLDEIITATLTDHYDTEESDIVKILTELIHNLSLDKTDYSAYNESIAHRYKHEQHQIESEVNPDYEVHCID